uniref:Vitellogenin domain-containing protein n=1 Tax=Timema cristinae TaxID=61476 RepID=A0A7R9CW30_TIMCR|nr:unnamed protein product [Timema cristinae]
MVKRQSDTSRDLHRAGESPQHHFVEHLSAVGDRNTFSKFHNMTYTKLHTELEDGWWGDIPTSEQAYRTLPITGSSIRALMDRGVIESLSVSNDLDDWEINFIQGVLGHLQLDLTNRNGGDSADDNVDHTRGRDRLSSVADPVYKVMEDSLMGHCEVLYEISQLPKSYTNTNPDWLPLVQTCGSRDYLEITKTYNYSNCESSSEYHFGLPSSLNCNPSSNQCGNFWKIYKCIYPYVEYHASGPSLNKNGSIRRVNQYRSPSNTALDSPEESKQLTGVRRGRPARGFCGWRLRDIFNVEGCLPHSSFPMVHHVQPL